MRLDLAAPIACGAIGCLVFLGWVFEWKWATSVYPGWVTMKPMTALSFMLLGYSMWVLARAVNGRWMTTAIGGVWVVLFTTVPLVFAELGNVNLGVSQLFIEEDAGATMTTRPGVPSLGTMLVFVCVTADCLLSVIQRDLRRRGTRLIGAGVVLLGTVGLIGYLIGAPVLFWYHPSFSTAMAIHTCLCSALLGVSMILRDRDYPDPSPAPVRRLAV